MLSIFKYYRKLERNKSRTKIALRLKEIEESCTKNNAWSASLDLNIKLLNTLRVDLLLINRSDYSSIYLNTGIKNITYLFDWTNGVITTLKNREAIPFDLTRPQYNREPVSIDEFLTTSNKKRYPIDALYINLLSELNTINHHFNSIKDPRYYDRNYAAIDSSWVDIFAIVEMLCTLGVTHE